MPKYLTVVLGAGSSHDCVAQGGISEFDENWRPPVTAHLFQPSGNFNRILSKYPKVSAVSEDIRTRLRNGQNLEDILMELDSSRSLQVKKQVWEVAFYLQELLWTVSDQFVKSGGTKFDTLVSNLLTAGFDRVLFLTLNYDLLLDNALARFEDHAFGSAQDYIPADRKWLLVKAHGSVNWGRMLMNGSAKGNVDATIGSLADAPDVSSEITIIPGTTGLLGFTDGNRFRSGRFLFPALAIPIRGEKAFACPREQIEAAKEFLMACDSFLFIGFSGLDPHLLDLFAEVSSVRSIAIVNRNKEEGVQLLTMLQRRNERLVPPGSIIEACAYPHGFRAFMESPSLARLIKP